LGIQRTSESSAAFTLRAIEEECIKGLYESVEFKLPTDIALYVLNNKREKLAKLEAKYDIRIIISADSSICNVADLKVERTRKAKQKVEQVALTTAYAQEQIDVANENDYDDDEDVVAEEENSSEEVAAVEAERDNHHKRRFDRRGKYGRRGRRYNNADKEAEVEPKVEAPVLIEEKAEEPAPKEKKTWWKKLIG
jgi:ribonuclease E